MQTIRWGMLGCGAVTEQKSGPAFQKIVGSSLVAVMSRNGDHAADYAKRHGVPRWYGDASRLIQDPEVDAIYIATPPNAHLDYTLQAARAGKPVYVEKPMGLSFEHSRQMVDFCKEAGVPLFSAYYRRALPKFMQIRKMLADGAIGTVRAVTVLLYQRPIGDDLNGSSWRVKPEIAGGGRFHDVGCHTLDLLDWYFGPIVEAKGIAGRQENDYPAEDIVSGSWKFAGGVQGSGMWVFNAWSDHDRVEVIGTKGNLSFSVQDLEAPIEIVSEGESRTLGVPEPPQHVAQPLIQTIVDTLQGKGTCPSTGESAMRTDWVMSQLTN